MYVINLNDDWRLFTAKMPPGGRGIGSIVDNETQETGALVVTHSADAPPVYSMVWQTQFGGLETRELHQDVAAKMIARLRSEQGIGGGGRGQGERARDGSTGGFRLGVCLDAAADARASRVGKGERSMGIRVALRQWAAANPRAPAAQEKAEGSVRERQIRLDAETDEIAKRAGNGNRSAGIRAALRAVCE